MITDHVLEVYRGFCLRRKYQHELNTSIVYEFVQKINIFETEFWSKTLELKNFIRQDVLDNFASSSPFSDDRLHLAFHDLSLYFLHVLK